MPKEKSGSSLLWETLTVKPSPAKRRGTEPPEMACRPKRLPFEKQCAGVTRSGRRCKGRIRKGADFCSFHDPAMTTEHRKRNAAMGGRSRANLAHIPGGYLRKLNSLRAIGDAMDRLYREIRLGLVTPEMGDVLFRVLTRILDSGLYQSTANGAASRRAKAVKLRPKLAELLTLEERRAWRQAVVHAPAEYFRPTKERGVPSREGDREGDDLDLPVSAAS